MKTANKCYQAKAADIERKWFFFDAAASDVSLGRVAVRIATVLMGKHKPIYTPHVDTGDYVIVVNAGKIKYRGTHKAEQQIYQYYTRYPSGQKEYTLKQMLAKHPEKVLFEAVRRMLPKNALASRMLTKLKLFAGATHPHQAQDPEPLPL